MITSPTPPKTSRDRLRPISDMRFTRDSAFDRLIEECVIRAQNRTTNLKSSNSYALQNDTLNLFDELLDRLNPRLIVEFGSGQSTHVFSAWAAVNGADILSIEHDKHWAQMVESEICKEGNHSLVLIHSPLMFRLAGARLFFTYGLTERLADQVAKATLILIDGPHGAGRENVLYFVLNHCSTGATIVIDDFNLYSIRDMLATVPADVAGCFLGAAVEHNSHGLYVLRCDRRPPQSTPPTLGLKDIARSFWRCLLDYRTYGRGN